MTLTLHTTPASSYPSIYINKLVPSLFPITHVMSSMPDNPMSGLAMTTEVTMVAVVFVFMAFVLFFFLFLRARRYWGVTPMFLRRRVYAGYSVGTGRDSVGHCGLDADAIKALPVVVFHSDTSVEGLECAVCLSELADGEEARLLPKCGHGFHLECIDMWFYSHSTCPLCRCPVAAKPSQIGGPGEGDSADGSSGGPSELPANVLFWGSQGDVSQVGPRAVRSSPHLVIEIPRTASTQTTPMPPSGVAAEDATSPAWGSLRSLRRFLRRGSSNPREGDHIEQGVAEGRAAAAKTTPESS